MQGDQREGKVFSRGDSLTLLRKRAGLFSFVDQTAHIIWGGPQVRIASADWAGRFAGGSYSLGVGWNRGEVSQVQDIGNTSGS